MDRQAGSLKLFLDLETPEQVHEAIVRAFGARYVVWQRFDPDFVRTWDRFPSGFFEHYYGTDADRDCAVAKAVRLRWPVFSFSDARAQIDRPQTAPPLAVRVWEAFGIRDGVAITGGRRNVDTVTAIAFDDGGDAKRLRPADESVLRYAAALLDQFLLEADEQLVSTSRAPASLSQAMRAVLQVAIEQPGASRAEQAAMLGISPRMLEKRHSQIAKRFGVSSFAGAVAKAVRGSAEGRRA
ncbi:MAG: hypothetical protein RIB45_13530 [Marivibrio sp.]|uniref:helix-turn-helix transcriptional regulator n=1 Tax=Marivibrio sp. TaxID=2039719 RepID=UPI0032EC1075